MATLTSENLMASFDRLRFNPIGMKRLMIDGVEYITDGNIQIVEATNPFVYLSEASCVLAAAQVIQSKALSRKIYPSLAVTPDELYNHMSDQDYIGRFASPARTDVTLWLSLEEILQKAVEIPNGGGVKKLTIPRNTRITVANMSLTMQYPVDIKVMTHGGISVSYDVSKPSPLQNIEVNAIRSTVTSFGESKYLSILLPLLQMHCETQTITLNNVTGFSKTFDFTDKYYYTRCFIKRETSADWMEIKTTHADQTFDLNMPTVVLKVDTVSKKLNVMIPQIYFNNGSIQDAVRIDIYTTQGDVNVRLENYRPSAFTAEWIDLDDSASKVYTEKFNTFSNMAIFSSAVVSGGAEELSFDVLRDRVVKNAINQPLTSITYGALESTLERMGYQLITNIDNVVNREYAAVRRLPVPASGTSTSGIGACIGTLQAKFADLQAFDSITDATTRMTIRPTTLFKMERGVLSIVPSSVVNDLLNPTITTPEGIANFCNNGTYLFTPFYYVLDIQGEEFNVRPYRLDKPEIISKTFYAENPAAIVEIGSNAVSVSWSSIGYSLFAEVKASDTFLAFDPSDVFTQLSFLPTGSAIRKFIAGEQINPIDPDTGRPIDGTYLYRFRLETAFDVNALHGILLNDGHPFSLLSEFDLVYMVKNWIPPNGSTTAGDMDLYIKPDELPGYAPADTYLALSQEKIVVRFGHYLEHLWARCRSVVGNLLYQKYASTVMSYYTKTLFVVDPVTGQIELTRDPMTSEWVYNVLHYKDDPVLVGNPAPVTDITVTGSGASTLTFTTTTFTGADVGKTFALLDGHASVDKSLVGTITNVVSAHVIDISVPTGRAVANGAKFYYGDHEILHAIGDTIYIDGEAQVVGGMLRGMVRQADLYLMDAAYYFTNDESSINDYKDAVESVTQWITNDMELIANRLLENTAIYFYPKTTIGWIKGIAGEGAATYIPASQHMAVTYHMTDTKYRNLDLREALVKQAAVSIDESFQAKTISRNLIERKLTTATGSDTLSIVVMGFADNANSAISMVDGSYAPSLGKKLSVMTNRQLQVQDDLSVEFVRHADE